MADDFTDEILIEEYLKGKLDETGKKAIQNRMESDPTFAKKVQEMEFLYEGLEDLKILSFAEKLKNSKPAINREEKEQENPAKNKIVQLYGKWAAVAAVAMLLIIGWNWARQFSNENISKKLLTVSKSQTLPRGAQFSKSSSLKEGMDAFDQEHYEEAITYFSKITPDSTSYMTARFYLAHSYLYLQQYKAANDLFLEIIEKEDSRYLTTANWNLLVIAVAQGAFDEQFHTALNNILEEKNNPYYSKVVKLQKDLGSFWRYFNDSPYNDFSHPTMDLNDR